MTQTLNPVRIPSWARKNLALLSQKLFRDGLKILPPFLIDPTKCAVCDKPITIPETKQERGRPAMEVTRCASCGAYQPIVEPGKFSFGVGVLVGICSLLMLRVTRTPNST